MKKLLLTLFLLLLSNTANAWEATVGLGGYGKMFDEKDQLGAVSFSEPLKLKTSMGLALNGSFLFNASPSFKIGPDISFGYGWVSTAINEKLDSQSFQNQTIVTSINLQYQVYDFRISVKPGFVVNTLTDSYTDKIDSDTGFSSSIKFSTDLFPKTMFFFEPQVLFSPSIESKDSFVPSYSLTLGFEQIFSPKKVAVPVVEKPVEVKPVVKTPEPIVEPAKLPEPVTPVKQPDPPIKVEEIKTEPQLNVESKGYLENILKVHKVLKSSIKIIYSEDKVLKEKAEKLATWFAERGVSKEDIVLTNTLETKGIRIEILKK